MLEENDIVEWQEDGEPIHRIKLKTLETVTFKSISERRTFRVFNLFSISSMSKILKQTFLPIGFPKSTPPDYLSYQFWNLLQDLCSYLRGIMATRAVLISMGVGRAEVTAYQATIQWLLRDGAGLIGSLMFTSLSSYNFGQNVKIWRLFADMINNVGITLDMLAPMLSYHNSAIILCIASVCKALCGVAAGATGAAINAHFGSMYNNNADIMAKNGAQHNIVTLIGLGMSIWLAKAADEASPSMIWIVYIILTVVHMYSNYRAMRVLSLRSLNIVRYELLINRFLSCPLLSDVLASSDSSIKPMSSSLAEEVAQWSSLPSSQHLFSPSSVAQSEPILGLLVPAHFHFRRSNLFSTVEAHCRHRCYVHLWSSFNQLLENCDANEKSTIITQLQQQLHCPYIVLRLCKHQADQIYVCISKSATSQDIAKSFFEAELWRTGQDENTVRTLAEKLFPIFWQCLKDNSWITENILLKPFGATSFEVNANPLKKSN